MWQFFKDFHFYHPSEKRAIVLLLTLILFTIGGTFGMSEHTNLSSHLKILLPYRFLPTPSIRKKVALPKLQLLMVPCSIVCFLSTLIQPIRYYWYNWDCVLL